LDSRAKEPLLELEETWLGDAAIIVEITGPRADIIASCKGQFSIGQFSIGHYSKTKQSTRFSLIYAIWICFIEINKFVTFIANMRIKRWPDIN
jgi:hypothetical protein